MFLSWSTMVLLHLDALVAAFSMLMSTLFDLAVGRQHHEARLVERWPPGLMCRTVIRRRQDRSSRSMQHVESDEAMSKRFFIFSSRILTCGYLESLTDRGCAAAAAATLQAGLTAEARRRCRLPLRPPCSTHANIPALRILASGLERPENRSSICSSGISWPSPMTGSGSGSPAMIWQKDVRPTAMSPSLSSQPGECTQQHERPRRIHATASVARPFVDRETERGRPSPPDPDQADGEAVPAGMSQL